MNLYEAMLRQILIWIILSHHKGVQFYKKAKNDISLKSLFIVFDMEQKRFEWNKTTLQNLVIDDLMGIYLGIERADEPDEPNKPSSSIIV